MGPYARKACQQATWNIHQGDYTMAIACLKDALHGTHNRKAWSKLMLAIRELVRIAAAQAQ